MTSTKTTDTMTELRAKPVVKNKFWIVQDGDQKVATIQAIDEGGFVYVHDNQREKFPTVNLLKKKLNINFERVAAKTKTKPAHEVYDYPCSARPYNELWDVSKKIPIYTKTEKSKSFFCAGYYIIRFEHGWVKSFCPKLITLQRYEYNGPYKKKLEMTEQLRLHNDGI